jgi:predicted ATP-grasp superfamily ATP-dependent carboligase
MNGNPSLQVDHRNDSEPHAVTSARSDPTILVHEWVTGGSMADLPLPTSWAAEGRAMRRAIAGDFAAMNGGWARVIVTLDSRLDDDQGPWTVERLGCRDGSQRVLELARQADYTVVIAPETMSSLAGFLTGLEEAGARLLGSSVDSVELAGRKDRLGEWLAARGIDTPPCRRVSPSRGLPPDAVYPAVLKPVDGAGTIDTYFVEHPAQLPASARTLAGSLMQPYVAGQPMSASFLVNSAGRAWLIAIGEQRITRSDGQFAYRGGRIPAASAVDERPLRAAVESIPGLLGFVGVDFIWDPTRGRTTVLEINPRATTSIVAITRLLPPGHLASAWICACDPRSDGAGLMPGLRKLIEGRPPVVFDASGTVLATGADG